MKLARSFMRIAGDSLKLVGAVGAGAGAATRGELNAPRLCNFHANGFSHGWQQARNGFASYHMLLHASAAALASAPPWPRLTSI